MMRIIIFLWILFFSYPVNADVFKETAVSENAAVVQALKEDHQGVQYKFSDLSIDSALNQNDYTRGRGGNKTVPRGYGSFDLNQGIKNYLKEDQFTNGEVREISSRYSNALSQHELMLMQYANPAAADLFKHNEIAALLKMGIRVQQYNQLQAAVVDPFYKIIARSQLLCINEKLSNASHSNLDKAFNECRLQDVFKSLPGEDVFVFKYSLNLIGTSASVRDDVLMLIGDINLKDNDYNFIAPKRIGIILKEEKSKMLSKINEIIETFMQEQSVSEDQLKEIILPGMGINAHQIRNIMMLPVNTRAIVISSLASQLAYQGTLTRYNQADEFLRRICENPNVDALYKEFAQERRQYIKEEILSLVHYKDFIEDYHKQMTGILNQANQQRSSMAQELGRGL